MDRNWRVTEKVIGAVQIAWGITVLIVFIWSSNQLFMVIAPLLDLTWDNISLGKILINYHFSLLLPLLTALAGLGLLMNKKAGWIASVVLLLINGTSILISFWTAKADLTDEMISTYLFGGITTVAFFLMTSLLMTRYFRLKYEPTPGTWWTIIILALIILTDRVFI